MYLYFCYTLYTGCNRDTGTKLNHVYKNSKHDFLQEWQKASNRLIFDIIGLKQGD